MTKTYWKDILIKIEKSVPIEHLEIDCRGEMINWKSVRILSKSGIKVPHYLIDYYDESIDYSDIPATTDEIINEIDNKNIITIKVDD